jgi:ATP-dependent DNA helicase RecG
MLAMPVDLDAPIGRHRLAGSAALRRHGPRLGTRTLRELLFHLPRRYEDRRHVSTVDEASRAPDGASVTVRGSVAGLRVEQGFGRRVQRTVARLRDGTGDLEAVWFGRRYIERKLRDGDTIVASGRLRHWRGRASLSDPDFELDDGSAMVHVGRIVPVYRLTRGVTIRGLRTAVRGALDALAKDGGYREYLPDHLRGNLVGIAQALEWAHFPPGFEQRDAALRRLGHDELLALQLGMVARRRQRGGETGPRLEPPDAAERGLRASIIEGLRNRLRRDVELTADQLSAMDAVRADLAGERPMLRLIQGDVGSGKTAVATYALALAALSGSQGALLAPTDLLARQHAATLSDLLEGCRLSVTLLTGSLSAAGRRSALEAIASGQAGVVVGTHALFAERVEFANLAVVVIDEQHRFGVAQREAFASKGRTPHVLLMTATPIPRTLGQVLYADLDVSDLRAAPSDRPEVMTGIRASSNLDGTWQRIREEAAAGHRAFVVAPLIDAADEPFEGDDAGEGEGVVEPDLESQARAAEEVHRDLSGRLAPLRVGLVHGRMKAQVRDAEMSRFRDGDLDVLVGTTVVEVGVDVPEATMMVVLGADRFGLSQLHQLRGRVGRGTRLSFCVLVADVERGTTAAARLEAVARTRDGFKLAEEDFQLRREGDVLGLSQSGLPLLRVASIVRTGDREVAVACREVAERILDDRGELPPELAPLRRELEIGWLARLASGEAAAEEGIGA